MREQSAETRFFIWLDTTAHLVDDRYDHGAIVSQTQVPVLSGDTVEDLSVRVLTQEHAILVQTLRRMANDYAAHGPSALAALGRGHRKEEQHVH